MIVAWFARPRSTDFESRKIAVYIACCIEGIEGIDWVSIGSHRLAHCILSRLLVNTANCTVSRLVVSTRSCSCNKYTKGNLSIVCREEQ